MQLKNPAGRKIACRKNGSNQSGTCRYRSLGLAGLDVLAIPAAYAYRAGGV